MIVFDLECQATGHRFEGWFGSSDDFASQQSRGLLACPHCGSDQVIKAPMAPSVPRKGNQLPVVAPRAVEPASPAVPDPISVPMAQGQKLPPEAAQMMQALASLQAEALKTSRWVGDKFAEKSRAMHYGESDAEPIHGQATLEEAKDLLEEGIAIAPLLVPVVPPAALN